MPSFLNFRLSVIDERETAVDTEARRVVLHLMSRADTDIELNEGEYYFILTMSEDRRMVDETVEFMDSAHTEKFVARLHGGPSNSSRGYSMTNQTGAPSGLGSITSYVIIANTFDPHFLV